MDDQALPLLLALEERARHGVVAVIKMDGQRTDENLFTVVLQQRVVTTERRPLHSAVPCNLE